MTIALVPFTFNDTKLFTVTVDGKHWTRGREPVRALGYSKHTKTAHVIKDLCTAENIRQKDQLIGVLSDSTPVLWPSDSQKYDLYINEEAMYELGFTSQQDKQNILENIALIHYFLSYGNTLNSWLYQNNNRE